MQPNVITTSAGTNSSNNHHNTSTRAVPSRNEPHEVTPRDAQQQYPQPPPTTYELTIPPHSSTPPLPSSPPPQHHSRRKKGISWLKNKLSIRSVFIVVCSLQVILLSFAIWFSSYKYGEKAVDYLSGQIIGQITQVVLKELSSFLQAPVLCTLQTYQTFYYGNGLDVNNLEQVRRHLWVNFQTAPTEVSQSFARSDGEYMSYRHLYHVPFLVLLQDTRTMARDFWSVDLESGLPLTLVRSDTFPAMNTWYTAAAARRTPGWSPIYFTKSSSQLVLPFAIPFYDVTGRLLFVTVADVSLQLLTNYITSLRVSSHARIFIIDPSGMLVAVSNTAAYNLVDPETGERYHYLNFTDPYIKAAAIQIENSFEGLVNADNYVRIQYDYEGDTQLLQATTYQGTYNLRWVVAVAVPQSDFTQALSASNRVSVAIFISALVISIVVISVITTQITRPLLRLGCRMNEAAKLQISEKEVKQSPFFEVRHLQNSFGRMQKGLLSFSKYVPLEVVRTLLAQNLEASLGLESSYITILFSDIQDFTTISEQLDAVNLANMTNVYFENMTDRIIANKGVVDKYIGDSIMAFWNPPIYPTPEHTCVACDAALQCMQFVATQNEKWARMHLPQLKSRIGIHTGPALVGNVGSTKRLNYTALGDSVNLASRLEGLNKRYGTRVLISQDVYHHIKEKFLCRALEIVKVKGKNQPTQVYELITWRQKATQEQIHLVQTYEFALELYKERYFSEALAVLEEGIGLIPSMNSDLCTKRLVEKCRRYLRSPPPYGWSAVELIDEK